MYGGVIFFQEVHNFTYLQSSHAMVWALLGLSFGGPLIGLIGGRKYIRPVSIIGAILTFLSAIFIMFFQSHTLIIFKIVLFLMGFFSTVYLLAYAFLKLAIDPKYFGIALGFCNFICIFGAVIFQPLSGMLLYYMPPLPFKYQYALLCFPIVLLISIIAAFFFKIQNNKKNAI